MQHSFLAIDLKSFYASVECRERGLDPLTTNLVVADVSRTEKTICLAVSPSLKALGISGRARLFEVVQKTAEINRRRLAAAPGKTFSGKSIFSEELEKDPSLELDYIAAVPRMAYYMEYSTRIYQIYLKYAAPEDILVYSIDEVMIDVTPYLRVSGLTPREMANRMIHDVLTETGITATAGIGTNLYLAKVAMDIMAKHAEPNADGVRIAELDEMSYRKKLWNHKPLTDFWRVGKGYAKKLEANGLYTMGDIAYRSEYDEELLYKLFGINAELLIDHAWGWEPCTMAAIKAYKPSTNSFSSAQVLKEPYSFDLARIVTLEMAEAAAMNLFEKRLAADQVVLTVHYDKENLTDPRIRSFYKGEVILDRYGKSVPKPSHGSSNLGCSTSSEMLIGRAVTEIYDRIVDRRLLVRRISIDVNHVVPESHAVSTEPVYEQMDLFTDYAALERERKAQAEKLEKERKRQAAVLAIRNKFGKNAVMKGLSYREGATGRERNDQIGGHKA